MRRSDLSVIGCRAAAEGRRMFPPAPLSLCTQIGNDFLRQYVRSQSSSYLPSPPPHDESHSHVTLHFGTAAPLDGCLST